jgi:hypothetical protein
MTVAKRSNVFSMAVVSVVSILGAAACKDGGRSESEEAFLLGGKNSEKQDSCKSGQGKVAAEATGSSESYARKFLEEDLREKFGKWKDSGESETAGAVSQDNKEFDLGKFVITCTTNGRAATQYTCVARHRKGAEQKESEQIVASAWREDEDESSAARAEAEDLNEKRKKEGNYFNPSGPIKVYENKEEQSGKYRWQYTYQIKACK